jgi:sugar lactone lactonase YvrE
VQTVDTQNVELIADYACETGENPLWHPLEKKLYWTDIPTGRLFSYDPHTGSHAQIYSGRLVGGFTFQSDGGILLFRDCGNIALWRNGQCIELLEKILGEEDSRFNDVIAEPNGRVFCGTMSTSNAKGRLYRLDTDGQLTPILDEIGCSNGMGFSPDLKNFYHTDSFAGEIYSFDYDVIRGTLANRKIFATIPSSVGLPDGLTVDLDGNIWSALWDGSSLLQFRADGTLLRQIFLPARKVSSLTFGGDELRDIYVTTAGGNHKALEGMNAGALFRIHSAGAGHIEYFSQVKGSCIRF